MREGAIVGVSDGDGEGAGDSVGDSLGFLEGLPVTDGVRVGVSDGEGEGAGDSVGACVNDECVVFVTASGAITSPRSVWTD